MSDDVELSKFLSLVLRHQPQVVGLALGDAGWVEVAELLSALAHHGRPIDRATLERLVAESDKQRFALSADGSAIRANQGHSLNIDLGLVPSTPPALLFHGTVERFLDSIRRQGLLKGQRHHVHLSPARDIATTVGNRRGEPVVLEVDSRGMVDSGHSFFRSENGVWLTDHVPARFIHFPVGSG